MKKRLTVALSLLMSLLLVLPGCSSKPAQAKQPSPTPSEAVSPDTSADLENASEPVGSANERWSLVADSTVTHSVHYAGYLNAELGYTVGYAGETHYTEDGGQNWPKGENSSLCRFGLDIVDENIAWSVGNGRNVRLTTNGGKNWTAVTDYNANGIQSYASFCDDQTGLVGSAVKFGLTVDGGNTWTDVKLPKEGMTIASLFLSCAEQFYVLSDEGVLYCTGDGGKTYTEIPLNLGDIGLYDLKGNKGKLIVGRSPVNTMSFTDDKHGIICMLALGENKQEGYKVYVLSTEDGGETWDADIVGAEFGFIPTNIYISRDGSYLTLQTRGRLVVLERQL
jgi:photosystem II stability/assembly factor-like uncharacterized protein